MAPPFFCGQGRPSLSLHETYLLWRETILLPEHLKVLLLLHSQLVAACCCLWGGCA